MKTNTFLYSTGAVKTGVIWTRFLIQVSPLYMLSREEGPFKELSSDQECYLNPSPPKKSMISIQGMPTWKNEAFRGSLKLLLDGGGGKPLRRARSTQ